MKARDSTQEHHEARSDFVRKLVQHSREYDVAPPTFSAEPSRTIVQFWNDMKQLPGQGQRTLSSLRSKDLQ